jgi:maltose alpha-D-glucosyltransferase / alpha-amylase
MSNDARWYTNAIIYGIDVAKFADGNGDGIGDFCGLTQRVTYLRDLGITCVWLLPFFGTPNRDNGYDVVDYYGVNPNVGTRDDFLEFLHSAGEHGIRVIIDLVVNHTSDQHAWFEAARRDEKCRFRDYYIWSHDPPSIEADEKSIFPDAETSVWKYDDVARAYYFHKFYHFEPDLNVANREVRQEILRIIDCWLAYGISGFRIDAAPVLIGIDGFKPVKPPDPYGVLEEMHALLATRRHDGLLLGEVNLEPDRLGAYFGDNDRLGLLFNFHLAAHLFLALAQGNADAIHAAMRELPEPSSQCAWANFLRHLDELDLSRIDAEAREALFSAFAPDDNMRVFGRGIRRRTAPMLNGDQRRIELAFSLLLSMPGAPVIVYGDEIGLGDDLEQPGRNSVRAPMQWDASANGGFSSVAAKALVQAPIDKGKFSYKRVNVAAQLEDTDSLLNRIKRLIALRRKHDEIGPASWNSLESTSRAVLAHFYGGKERKLVLVHNLAGNTVRTRIRIERAADEELADLVTAQRLVVANGELAIELEPYAYRWLTSCERG